MDLFVKKTASSFVKNFVIFYKRRCSFFNEQIHDYTLVFYYNFCGLIFIKIFILEITRHVSPDLEYFTTFEKKM